jgi:hypothetical protein
MCWARILLASSMNGLFWVSVSIFHSEPRRREISELCILGLSWAILRRWIRDQTMKAFIGLLMCSFLSLPGEEEEGDVEEVEPVGDICVMADMAERFELMPERLCMWLGIWYIDMLGTPLNIVWPASSTVILLREQWVTTVAYCAHREE